ncbi:hypothetical protein ACFQJD_05015 [Haloplanus sp. GCM10025708]|uniref:hypothetical protein n=1 Tax=Haloferacaceae TaxID=1644056 RepID=UPI0036184732
MRVPASLGETDALLGGVAATFESLAGVGAILAAAALLTANTDLATTGVGVGVVGALGSLTAGFVRTALTE